MEIFKIVSFAIISVLMITILKSIKKDDFALVLTIITSIILFGVLLVKLEGITTLLENIISKAGINKEYLTLLFKVTGISYVVELATNICKDAGSSSLAAKLEMIGKISIVVLTIPILTSVVSVILEIV